MLIALVVLAATFIAAAFLHGRQAALVVLAAGLFGALLALALGINGDWPTRLDTSVADWFDAHRTRRRDIEAAGVFGYIGRPLHVLAAAVVCAIPLSIRMRSALPGFLVVGAVGVGVLVEHGLKATIGRTATTGPLREYPHSYPSGHVAGTAALLGTIALCVCVGRSGAIRRWLAAVVVAAVLTVACLALYTGAHTCTDVIGGMMLGGSILAAAAAVLRQATTRGAAVSAVRRSQRPGS